MILVDVNVLLYARMRSYDEHREMRDWLDSQLAGASRVGMPWSCLLSFARLATSSRIFSNPLRLGEAWKQVEEWLSCAPVWTPTPTDQHRRILGELLAESRATLRLISDAHLGALAIEHGLTVCSTDSDFVRFPSVRSMNPLTTR